MRAQIIAQNQKPDQNRFTLQTLYREAKENSELLEKCEKPHQFTPITKGIVTRQQCIKCRGVVGLIEAMWYERGLRDGQNGKPDNSS